MNKYVLMVSVAIMTLGIASESWAGKCDYLGIGWMELNGACTPCNDHIYNCNECSYDSDKNRAICSKCLSGYFLNEGECIHENVINDKCPYDHTAKINGKCEIMLGCYSKNANGICTRCHTGYTLDENNVCVSNTTQGIASAESRSGSTGCTDAYSQNECRACAGGYFLNNGKCYPISEMQNCSEINESSWVGTACLNNGEPGCAEGYYYIAGYGPSCQKCPNGGSCHFNTQTSSINSDSCPSGYYLNEGRNDCIAEWQCTQSPNMYFNTIENKCKYKPDGCKNVNPDGSCVADEPCWEGYSKNASGKCYKPVESCEEGKFAKEDQCVSECGSGYLVKSGTTCVEPAACTGEYIVDETNGTCIKMPGCVDYADGACGGCENGYYKKDSGCVSAQEGCGSGYLEKDSVCISSANGCGAGYKDMGGWCNRIQYTPAEAAQLLTDDNTNSVTITFRK